MKLLKRNSEKIKSKKNEKQELSAVAESNENASECEEKNLLEQDNSCELDDDLLSDVSGGLVQLVNPSSARL